MGFHSATTVANLLLLLPGLNHRSLHFDISVIMDVGRHKRGQTLSSAFGTQVQRSCNT